LNNCSICNCSPCACGIAVLPQSPIVISVQATPVTQSTANPIIVTPGQGGAIGPQGIQGIQGIQGTVGPQPNIFYTHTQSVPSATWTIPHNLNGHPTVVVLDSAGTQCEGNISYTNNNIMVLTFSAAFSGIAYVI
jgi:hypothetical protein